MENTQPLPKSIEKLIETIKAQEAFTPRLARQILEESEVTADDLMLWADFIHPKADSYGRKLVYDGEYFELMVMSWVDGDMAAIHDHGYAEWGAVKLFGPAEHAVFKNEDGKMTTLSRFVCEPGTVLAVDNDMIHQMGNVGNAPYLTLHLYGSYDFKEGVTADARLYDLDENKVQFTCGGVFFELPEGDIKRRENGPEADFPTWLRHQVEMMKRLMRKNDSWTQKAFVSDRESQIAKALFTGATWDKLYEELGELDAKTGKQATRYKEILDQELYMAAKLQLDLLNTGVLADEYADFKYALETTLGEQASPEFSVAYLQIIEKCLKGKPALYLAYAA